MYSVGSQCFIACSKLTDFYCYSEFVPDTRSSAFDEAYVEYSTLHVPSALIDQYRSRLPWSNFGSIVALDSDNPNRKCSIPTISFEEGILKFSCETENAQFVSEITDNDITKHYDSEYALEATYHISVYAASEGYEDSDMAYATLSWIDAEPKSEGLSNNISQARGSALLIQNVGSTLYLSGTASGSIINIYNISGSRIQTATASDGQTSISTSLHRGDVAIIKIGDRTVKFELR